MCAAAAAFRPASPARRATQLVNATALHGSPPPRPCSAASTPPRSTFCPPRGVPEQAFQRRACCTTTISIQLRYSFIVVDGLQLSGSSMFVRTRGNAPAPPRLKDSTDYAVSTVPDHHLLQEFHGIRMLNSNASFHYVRAHGAPPLASGLSALRPRLGPIPRASRSKRVVAKPIQPVIIRESYTAT